ncbi:DUF4251 domain-containing protein [Fulvivirga sp. RKSG066]|uniref:DUF4251 domain-containing protein n=1 Tax=Fulvivirga aurantia TaxID=2529383 RepID=UPI0012BBF166|nr:DUF4251 domain-containing protein [Fulvivirga aurantia]MTI22029.1 DUF4251 domain-containing protein [Fulvivirga aurantia]
MLFIKKVKHLLLTTAVVLATISSSVAQDEKQSKEEKRAAKKQAKKEQFAENMKVIESAVADSAFVIEADAIRGRYSANNFVMPTTNFVKIEGDEVVVQTANNFSAGYNGLGGITIRGSVREYSINERDESVNVFIQMSSATLGFSTLNIFINASGHASADLRTNQGGYVNFSGDLRLLEATSTFEGMPVL